MKTKHIVGTTAENDNLSLPEGMLSIDSEKKALRFYDGVTVGGYEMVATRAVPPPPTGPGPQELIAGDMQAGFFGETTSAELLTYEALASEIGLSAGTSHFNAESLWLKFALDGEVLYVAKKTARHSISWDELNTANIVYKDGLSPITVGTYTLDVTLLKGAITDPAGDATEYDVPESYGSEWNRLIYPIYGITFTHTDPNAAPGGTWAGYGSDDLLIGTVGIGGVTWCQELHSVADGYSLHRGYRGADHYSRSLANDRASYTGWRPCLRLMT